MNCSTSLTLLAKKLKHTAFYTKTAYEVKQECCLRISTHLRFKNSDFVCCLWNVFQMQAWLEKSSGHFNIEPHYGLLMVYWFSNLLTFVLVEEQKSDLVNRQFDTQMQNWYSDVYHFFHVIKNNIDTPKMLFRQCPKNFRHFYYFGFQWTTLSDFIFLGLLRNSVTCYYSLLRKTHLDFTRGKVNFIVCCFVVYTYRIVCE